MHVLRLLTLVTTPGNLWDDIHTSNLKEQFLCTREVLRQGMAAQETDTTIPELRIYHRAQI